MEVFRNLEVTGGSSVQRLAFIADVDQKLPSGWKRDYEREAEVTRHLGGRQQFAFLVPARSELPLQNRRPAARLFIGAWDNELRVTNVVPDGVPSLTRKQYNSIIMEFVEIALPVAQQLGLKLDVTSDQQEMSELLGPEAWQALSSFSQLANKSTGSAHPNDRDRWFNFLILEHETGGRLSTELLERWLTEEERWPDNVASELVLQFEFGTDLLNAYDTRRR